MSFHKLLALVFLVPLITSHPIDFPEEAVYRISSLFELENEIANKSEYRLSDKIWPRHYDIKLTPHFAEVPPASPDFTFDGEVTITFYTVVDGEKAITLHANNLEIDNAEWYVDNSVGVRMTRGEAFTYQNETHKVTFPLGAQSALETGRDYKLFIKFKGVLDDSMRGFYRSYYKEDNKVKWLGTTQFQSTDARRSFPCFDEPRFKATFKITIVRPQGYQPTIGNTAIASTRVVEGQVEDTFADTPVMSTYLIAFIVSMYQNVKTEDGHFGVHARPEARQQMVYASEVGVKLLDKMGTWVGYPFNRVPEIQKLDMIAIPDFSAGAMENWGAMTYRESSLLWDPVESTAINKQRIAAVLTHEIAHLWFGDLLTCDWWSVTWLNEGFARFFQYFGTDMVEDKWALEWQFVVEQVQGVFQLDSTANTHPMTNPDTYSPTEASNMFSSISYNKGATILRWIQHHMGKENFQQAIKNYIDRYQYKTVLPENLFTEFERVVSNAQISQTFTLWTQQSGYPLLSVRREGNQLVMSQRRFMIDNAEPMDPTRWSIPLTVATNKEDFENTKTNATFPRAPAGEFTMNAPAGDLGFYIVNVQQVGYYRVNYDDSNWGAIKSALMKPNHGDIHVLNRAQIVDDLFNMARAGVRNYEFVFDIVDYLRDEKNYIPWLSAFNGLTFLSRRVVNGDDHKQFEAHINSILDGIYKHLGFQPVPNEDHIDTLNRINVLTWACKYNHEECVKDAKDEFLKLKTIPGHIVSANIRAPVYCTAIREGTRQDFDFLWTKYLTTNVAHEQVMILNSLGCAKTQELIDLLLDRVLSLDVRPQDKSSTFTSAINGNNENVDLIVEYLTMNYNKWEPIMGPVGSALATLADRFTREEQINNLESFKLTPNLSEDNKRRIDSGIDTAKKNIDWDTARISEFRTWVARRYKDSAASLSLSSSLVVATSLIYYFVCIRN